MKNVRRKLRKKWLDYWQDDALDMDKKHLSQYDKRSLLYGGFMVGAAIFIFISIGIMIGNVWADYRSTKAMEEVLDTIATYLATATEDEYGEIAQAIRHDFVYSQYGQDMENLIQYIPNTADGCCLERARYPERVNLVFLNTGETYGLDIFDKSKLIASQRENCSTMISFGYDEISQAHILIIKNPNLDSGTVYIDRGRGIVSTHKMKSQCWDDCIREILNTVEDEFMDEAVLYDAEEKKFYPITEDDLQIGDYSFYMSYEEGGYKIEIEYTGK